MSETKIKTKNASPVVKMRKSFSTTGIIPFILALIIFVGFFGLATQAQAQSYTFSNPAMNGLSNPSASVNQKTGGTTTVTSNATDVNQNGVNPNIQTETPQLNNLSGVSSTPNPDIQTTTPVLNDLSGNSTEVPAQQPAPLGDSAKQAGGGTTQQTTKTNNKSDFENMLDKGPFACGVFVQAHFEGCFTHLLYFLLMLIPSFILWLAALFFNVFAYVTLNGKFFSNATFISTAWAVVRDLSNIFFILILLYVAVRLIVGIGGHDAKKMIGKIVIMALLINFSMFFTEVIIDSSNILALIFYNKITVGTTTKDSSGKVTITKGNYDSVTGEKDFAGGLTGAFNPANQFNADFFKSAANLTPPPGGKMTNPDNSAYPSFGIVLGIMVLSGAVMLVASYALFVAGLSFLGRMIELFVLIIFSPFAFMSFTMPDLAGVPDIGWSDWFKRLLTASFMAPIFMFFMYFIFMLVGANLFGGLLSAGPTTGTKSFTLNVLGIFLPATLIVVLLLKATKYAKKGSGAFGEYVMKGAQLAGGLAIGAATGGAAIAGRATLGRAGAAMANSKWAQKWESKGFGGEYFRRSTAALGSGSFDVRGIKVGGKTLASATGMNVGEAGKGGFTERRKADIERRQKRAESLKTLEDQPLKQELNEVEGDLQEVLGVYSHELTQLDKRIKSTRQNKNDLVTKSKLPGATQADRDAATEASNKLEELKAHKKAIKNGDASFNVTSLTDSSLAPGATRTIKFVDSSGKQNNITKDGHSINKMEDDIIPEAQNRIEQEDIRMLRRYAKTTESGLGRVKDFIFSGGQNSYKGAREAAQKIRMGAKLDSGTKENSH